MSAASVLVTGASGFIGAHLVARLLSEGSRVTVLARSSSALPAEWRDRVRVIACDDFSENNLRRAAGYAGRSGLSSRCLWRETRLPRHRRNVADQCGTAGHVGAAMQRMARAHGDGGHLFGVSQSVDPGAAFGRFAAGAAQALRLVKGGRRFDGERDRPEQRHRVSPLASLQGLWRRRGAASASAGARQRLAKRERVAISAGTQVLDFVYIDDVVEAMLRADAHCREKGGIATWNVATGRRAFGSGIRRAVSRRR